jgi:aspartyl-tRNA(Asn)/glutamyl-tRNA(Gln) amidotransferase subunit A
MNLSALTIQEARRALQSKEFSAAELVRACIERIQTYDGKLKAFLTVDEQGALAQAKRVDAQIAKGISKKLFGIPVACKDLYSTRGVRTTAGSKIIDNYIPSYNATVVERYIDAGAIIIGKTNEDAWGHGSSGENSDYFPTRNPYDTSRVPGGSSSGSAVAVAAGFSLVGTGTDTGSSVRSPASFCNIVGMKPTYGRVSRYGVISMASSFDTIGHMTRTVYDNALVYEVTAGSDPHDATTPQIPVPMYTKALGKSVRGLKAGIPKEYFRSDGIEKGVREVTMTAIKKLESLGMAVEEISLPHTDYAMACYYILVPSEISSNLGRFDGIRFGHARNMFGAEAKRRIMLGTHALSAGYYDAFYLKAAKVRTLIKQDFEKALEKVDVIFAPVSPTPPFKLGEKVDDPLSMYLSDIFVCPVNIAGVPALSVPCGFVGILPIGLQIIGKQFGEQTLYQVAYAYEQETQWYTRTPKI